jgi:hypothetical protein
VLRFARGEIDMQTVIPLKMEDGRISFDQSVLPSVWLNEPIEAVLKSYGILIKPKSWSGKTRGIVDKRLSYHELDELYRQR